VAGYESIVRVSHRLGTAVANAPSSCCEVTFFSEKWGTAAKVPEARAFVSSSSNKTFLP